MFKRILTIVLCCSVMALFSPFIAPSSVHAAGEKCQCQKNASCKCSADCQCEHCKTGKGQCLCQAGEKGCACGKECACEHCKTGKGQCQCKAGEKGCACGKECACEHRKTGKGHASCRMKSKSSNAVPEASSTQMTASRLFKVSYKTEPTPIPMNAFHAWTLTVQSADGKAVTDAEIEVNGSMPLHGHGLQSTPTVKNLGNGEYLVEGVKFFMPGQWEMNFSIKSSGKEDKITFIEEI